MGKDKLRRFAENLTFECFVQPAFEEAFRRDHPLKGHWHSDFFHNDRPIVLELGCGKGEYTVALAERDPNRNFIGIDIKGARMWRGAKTATERQMRNVGFLRTRIEMIASFFAEGEVDEIWITFPIRAQIAPGQETAHLTPLPGPVRTDAGSRRTNQPQDRLATPLRLHASRDRTVRSALRRGQQRHLRLGVRGRNTLGQDRLRTDVPRTEGAPITYTRFSLGERRDFPPFDWEGDDTDEKDNEEARKNRNAMP